MSALGDFIGGFKRGWRRARGEPKPDPWVVEMMRRLELEWRTTANKRYRRYKSDLQKRGRRARDSKSRKLIRENAV